MNRYQKAIADECDNIKELLLTKNREYGNSVFEPVQLFCQAPPSEQIRVRIDDKISRIRATAGTDPVIKEDTIGDLIGYLVILKVAMRLEIDAKLACLASSMEPEPDPNTKPDLWKVDTGPHTIMPLVPDTNPTGECEACGGTGLLMDGNFCKTCDAGQLDIEEEATTA